MYSYVRVYSVRSQVLFATQWASGHQNLRSSMNYSSCETQMNHYDGIDRAAAAIQAAPV